MPVGDAEPGPGRRRAAGPDTTPDGADRVAAPEPSSYFLAGVLATGVAAVVTAAGTSFIGLQGTVVGALVGAMVGSIVSELAKRELSRVEARARARLIAARRRGLPPPETLTGTFRKALFAVRARLSRRLVLTVGGIALGGLIVGLAVVSAIELIAGRPLSAIETGGSGAGTTVGHLVAQAQSTSTPRPSSAPALAPSSQPGQFASPSPREQTGPAGAPTNQPVASPLPAVSPAATVSLAASPTRSTPPAPTPLVTASNEPAETTPAPSLAPRPETTSTPFPANITSTPDPTSTPSPMPTP